MRRMVESIRNAREYFSGREQREAFSRLSLFSSSRLFWSRRLERRVRRHPPSDLS